MTVNWSCAGVADVYINGKPLRDYKPDFLSREDEPAYEYHASASLKVGDVITVGAKKGKVAGFRLAVFNAKDQVVWQSETSNWRSYAVNPRVGEVLVPAGHGHAVALGPGHRGGQGISAAAQFAPPKADVADSIWYQDAEAVFLAYKITALAELCGCR